MEKNILYSYQNLLPNFTYRDIINDIHIPFVIYYYVFISVKSFLSLYNNFYHFPAGLSQA